MKVLAVISARGGSKGIPKKNLQPLCGKPLIAYMISRAKVSNKIGRLVVSTESEEIAEVARSYGAEVPFLRPAELATDDVPLIRVTQFVAEALAKDGWPADIVVQLQPTCPFIPTEKIDESIAYVADGSSDAAVSLRRIEHEHPYRAKELDDKGFFLPFLKDIPVEKFQQRQDLPPLYTTTGAIYTRRRQLLTNWSGTDFALGAKPRGVILNDIQGLNIDRPIDFQFANFLLETGQAPGI